MTKSFSRFLAALLVGSALLAAPTGALAVKGDCGQPTSLTGNPKASDAQTILKAAVGQPTDCDAKVCICNVNSAGGITTTDALLVLKFAVGQEVVLNCPCPPPSGEPACTSAEFQSRTGSDLDSGWTGIAHDSDLILGASLTFRTMRRCSDNQAECSKDSDCASNDCVPTCDCNEDVTCDITGPTQSKHCLTDLKDCETNRCLNGSTTLAQACTTNSDCSVGLCTGSTSCATGVTCLATFGPPLPLSSGGTPVCVLSLFDGPLTGTANSDTGAAVTQSKLKSRVFLGIAADKPCPTCGTAAQNPQIGGNFTCSGGSGYAQQGLACTVDGVSPTFGGTSFDCPPALSSSISGSGLVIRFDEVTTGTTTKRAELPCAASGFKNTPLRPGGKCFGGNNNGNACTADANCLVGGGYCNLPKCLDKVGTGDPLCTSNADCTRCTLDTTISCSNNGDCSGAGTCGEAPDQPVTCGYWCQCGFCDNNPSLPCFQTSDCGEGQTCQVGTGINNAQNTPQQRPNDCSGDKFICGEFEDEKCATTQTGKCSTKPYIKCEEGSNTCQVNNGGVCNRFSTPCFGPRITRTGTPSPLGSYCSTEKKSCVNNADCTGNGDFCVDDSSRAETVALFCVPATSNGGVNEVGGITGPGAIRLNGFLKVCRCGDGEVGCDEQCDDGDTDNGDGCDDLCQDE